MIGSSDSPTQTGQEQKESKRHTLPEFRVERSPREDDPEPLDEPPPDWLPAALKSEANDCAARARDDRRRDMSSCRIPSSRREEAGRPGSSENELRYREKKKGRFLQPGKVTGRVDGVNLKVVGEVREMYRVR